MAEALIVGALVSAGVDLLISKLASPEVIGFFKNQKLDEEQLKNLKQTMRSVKKVLNDAEERQITDENVRDWLDDLKDAFYKADDFVDQIAYEAARLKLEAGPQTQTCTDQVRSFLSSLVPCKKGMGEMQPELEGILLQLKDLLRQKDELGLTEVIGPTERIGRASPSQRLPTTSVVEASGVCGRNDDKEAIMKLLRSDGARGKPLDVIPIVGLPGVGKTTLAKLVYNDTEVDELFKFKVWVYVSEKMDVLKVTKDILRELTSENCDALTVNQLHTKLQEKLKEKVLLVLDDVWSEDQKQWDFLLDPFNSVMQGSKIVVTTRHERVASIRSTVASYHLRELTEEDCWSVFEKHAFVNGNSEEHPNLKEIGKAIVRKCQGLPLAARALGDHLRCSDRSRDAEYWKKILKSNLWDQSSNSILPALRLSYHYLPPQLKQCFAYCGIFPKGYQYRKKELVLLWTAEGFLGKQEMEEEGEGFFDNLASRSFFQPSNADPSCFVMHDLLNDLAKFVSGEFCFTMEDADSCQPSNRTRHSLISFNSQVKSNAFESIYEAPYLRTLIVSLKQLEEASEQLEGRYIDTVFSRLKCLRVLLMESYLGLVNIPDSIGNLKHLRFLNLASASIDRLPETVSYLYNLQTLNLDFCTFLVDLPDSIRNLKHLRCLSLQETSIKRLPDSTSSLSNLQTLNLYGCKEVSELPINMMKLTNLCYLDIRGIVLESMPLEMGRLRKLKKLTDFFLGTQCGSSIKELRELQHLRGELCIRNLQNIASVQDALEANLKGKEHLEKLELRWDGDSDGDGPQHYRILEQLQPHTSVKSINIAGYRGQTFPDWVGASSFSNISTLHLTECKYLSSLPPLGHLSSLKDLAIVAFDGLTAISSEFYGTRTIEASPFASLQILRFERMTQLQQWQDEDGAFSHLRELYIVDCPNLTTIPRYLPSLNVLVILGCEHFLSILPKCQVINMMTIKHDSQTFELEKLSSGMYYLKVEEILSLDDAIKAVSQVGCFLHLFEKLEISRLSSLVSFPMEFFPNLKSLSFFKCFNLRGFSLMGHLEGFTSLNSMYIESCQNFQFPIKGLPAPNLTHLSIYHCSRLESLPHSLVDLEVTSCPKLASFPKGGLPSKLQSLKISDCTKLVANRKEWGLQELPSLTKLIITNNDDYVEANSFPEETLLPSTLESLEIRSFDDLKSLSCKGIQHLTCLKELKIAECPVFESLPNEGLPSSLSSLIVIDCPSLKGDDWPAISHIPRVEINGHKIN